MTSDPFIVHDSETTGHQLLPLWVIFIAVVAVLTMIAVGGYLALTTHQTSANTRQIVANHNNDIANTHKLAIQIAAQTAQAESERLALVAAAKEQTVLAVWLIQTQEAICQATHATCPPVPNLPGVNS